MSRLKEHFLDYFPLYAGGFVISLILVTCIGACTQQAAESKRLLAQCMSDGRKEYECVSMLKTSNPSVVPVPIVLPMRSR